jgi:hypothetical protein
MTPGKTGIPAFTVLANDRWLMTTREIDKALAAYARVPADQWAALEAAPTWVSWLRRLALARQRGRLSPSDRPRLAATAPARISAPKSPTGTASAVVGPRHI